MNRPEETRPIYARGQRRDGEGDTSAPRERKRQRAAACPCTITRPRRGRVRRSSRTWPLLRDAASTAPWAVLDAPPAFYDITKEVPQRAPGISEDLSETEKTCSSSRARNARQLTVADVVPRDDRRRLRSAHFAKDPDRAGWVWCGGATSTSRTPAQPGGNPDGIRRGAQAPSGRSRRCGLPTSSRRAHTGTRRSIPSPRRTGHAIEAAREVGAVPRGPDAADPPPGTRFDHVEGPARSDRRLRPSEDEVPACSWHDRVLAATIRGQAYLDRTRKQAAWTRTCPIPPT